MGLQSLNPPTSPGISQGYKLGLAGLALVVMAACSGGGGGGSTPVPAPVATSLTPSSASPLYGGTFTLTPVYANGTGTLSNGVACPATGVASAAVTANWTGARTYTLTVTNSASATATATAVVTPQAVAVAAVSPATASVTVGLTQAFTSAVTGAADTSITWQVDGTTGGSATVGTITAAGVYTAGTATGNHTITALATADGTTSKTATVTVNAIVIPPPVATSLTASNVSPLYGGTFTLTPVYSAGTGAIDNGVTCPATGVASAAITASFTGAKVYTLTVTNSANVTATATATVTPQTVAVANVAPATATVSAAGTQTFTSSVSGAADSVITWSVDSIAGGNATVGTISAAGLYTAGTAVGAHTITATAHANGTTQKTATVTVVAGPAATSLVASTATPLAGGTFTLTPTYSGGTGTIDNSVTCPASGTASAAITANWTGARVYTLTVTNLANVSATTTVTVTPQTIALANVSPATATVTSGLTQAFTSSVSGAADSVITWSVDSIAGGNATVGTISAAGLYTAGTAAGAHTITATAHANGTTQKTATVTVVDVPVATSLVASTATPAFGATFTLTPTYSAGIGTLDHSVTCPASGTASAAITADWTGARVFTLTVTNAANTTNTTTVTVTPQTVVLGTVSPSTINLTTGFTQVFTSSVSGAADSTINWSVDTIAGGNASVGTITATGTSATYTAGTTGGSHTITATALANGATSTATVTVVAVPVVRSFTVSQATFSAGDMATFTADFDTDGSATIVSGASSTAILSNTPVSVTLDTSKTYTLQVVNSVGDGPATPALTAKVLVGNLSVLAGVPSGQGNTDGKLPAGTSDPTQLARFWEPNGILIDPNGNVFISDYDNNVIRKIDTAGNVTTPFGTVGLHGATNGTGTAAKFFGPAGLAMDAAGNLYVADVWNYTIRKIDTSGVVTTLAGTPGVHSHVDKVSTGTDTAGQSTFNFSQGNIPVGLALNGNILYVPDQNNNCIRTVDVTDGTVATLSGTSLAAGSADGSASSGTFSYPTGVAYVGSSLYVADYATSKIRVVDPATGAVSTLPVSVTLNGPVGLATDGTDLFETEYDVNQIYRITTAGVATLIAGVNNVTGSADGGGAAAKFAYPTALAVGKGGATPYATGSLLVADFGNNTIRTIDTPDSTTNTVDTLAGVAGKPGLHDDLAGLATMATPTGVVLDSANGFAYVADSGNNALRKVDLSTGATTTILHGGTAPMPLAFRPWALALDGTTLYMADYGRGTVVSYPVSGGPAVDVVAAGTFVRPTAVAVVPGGTTIYVADQELNTISKIEGSTVTLLVGPAVGGAGYVNGTTPSSVLFNTISGLALSPDGSILYIADQGNHAIRTMNTTTLAVDTFVGNIVSAPAGHTDGTGTAARFNNPQGLAIDAAGTLYVADNANDMIRMITPAGVVSTIAGLPGPGSRITGLMANIPATSATHALPATLCYPRGIAVAPVLTAGQPGIFIALPDSLLKIAF